MTALRRLIAAILILGMAGTLVELLLLGHHEDLNQWIPLVLIATALVLLLWTFRRITRGVLLLWRAMMVLFIIAGGVGTVLHFRANVEFQLEVNPSLAGAALFWKAVQAKAPPALAPGVMVQLGLLGLAYTFRYSLSETD